MRTLSALPTVSILCAVAGLYGSAIARHADPPTARVPLVTGKYLSPHGSQASVGSFPTTLVISPDGRFAVASSLGERCQLTVLRTDTGAVASTRAITGPHASVRGKRAGLYFGLAFDPDGTTLFAARGTDDRVDALQLGADGSLTETGMSYPVAAAAGVAADARRLYVASNTGDPANALRSKLTIIDRATRRARTVELPGYPLAVARNADRVFVTSEQDGAVHVIDPEKARVVRRIPTGAQPSALCLDRAGARLFVSNAGSDTVSIVDTRSLRVIRTLLLRPADARGLPSATPLGLALSPDEQTLFVALADLNAVALVSLERGAVDGYVPVGWYPTAVAVSPDGARLLVANAKGVAERNANGVSHRAIQTLFEGTVSTVPIGDARANLAALTERTLRNNAVAPDLLKTARTALANPGIEHVLYIIKENRTYDQVLGDLGKGDGDPSLTLFGRAVTPNLHAMAERFVLLDNFYCSAEVSGDGWNFSTAGSASAYVERNVAYGYTGKVRPYDYEGTNNGVAPDRKGIRDVGAPPGGYLWDRARAHRVSLRNFGMYTDDVKLPRRTAEEGAEGLENEATKAALADVTSPGFRQYDLTFADSDAWVRHGLRPVPRQRAKYGPHDDPSRLTTWRREYADLLRRRAMPRLMLVRLGRDHTAGTAAGQSSPRAMVADNDYAVGQLVETVSHGPLWKKTAIFVVEDDAQNGYDHVDAHRSIAFVISPFVPRDSHDSRFYNTDSVLHTIECLLRMDPMTLYDAAAPTLKVFGERPDNAEPYEAILPAREIIGEVNRSDAYRSEDSQRMIDPLAEESAPDEQLNDILWHALRGRSTPAPARVYGLRTRGRGAGIMGP